MLFRQLFDRESCTYTYLIAAGHGREAVLIDPVKEHIAKYIKLLSELDLTLVAAMDTHIHADHITALGLLRAELGCLSLLGEQSRVDCVSRTFQDNEMLQFDGISLKALYTPGHTDDSYCFLLENRVLTGDTLLIRGTGRTDFQHGNALQQYESIKNRLFSLPDETFVYPGHDYNGMTVSTIGEEKNHNPRLCNKTKEEYLAIMNGLDLPNPKLMEIAVPANRNCGLD